MSPGGVPVAWRYDPAALQLIEVNQALFDDDLLAAVQKASALGRRRAALVGYTWPASDWTSARVTAMRRLSAESAGKQQYVGFLKERYAYSIERVNEIYGLESTSFSDLLTEGFAALDTSRAAVAADDRQFLADCAARLAETLATELQSAHPGALLFSEPVTGAGIAADAFARHAAVLVTSVAHPTAKAQVILGAPPQPLPPNVVGLASDFERLESLLPIPKK